MIESGRGESIDGAPGDRSARAEDTAASGFDHATDARVWVAGHRGMAGSAIVRELERLGVGDILTRGRSELDLLDAVAVRRFVEDAGIERIYLAAARVGGIHANDTYPADFIGDNLAIELNVIDAAHRAGVGRLLFLGSSCIYPRLASQPITEEALLEGPLEPTNEPYAIAKIAGIKLCESYNRQHGTDYRSVMPTNLYGPGDNFHPENSHVVPAMLRRFHEARRARAPSVTLWGSGRPMREFLYVEDMAAACVHVMSLSPERLAIATTPRRSHLNVGTGEDCTIEELARTVARVVGYRGELVWDTAKPDGTPRKLLDVSRLSGLGWQARTSLEEGLEATYAWYLEELGAGRVRSA